jgi:hypothetical protein
VGEKIYNSTDDTESGAVEIKSITDDTHLVLTGFYGGTTGSGKTASVTGIDQCAFVAPASKTDACVLIIGDLGKNAYKAIWIKRVVSPNASGYESNQFALKLESS